MMVFPGHQNIHLKDQFVIEGCGWMACQMELERYNLNLIGMYAKCGEGIQRQTNQQLWSRLVTYVRHLKEPYMILGDFNVEPNALAETHLLEHMEAEIVAAGEETTLHGSELDWTIVSKSISVGAALRLSWEVPCRPHAQIILQMEMDGLEKRVPQVKKYPAIPKLESPQWQWQQCQMPVHDVQILHHVVKAPEVKYAAWAQQAEEYVLQNMEYPQKGRGRLLAINNVAKIQVGGHGMWKRGAMAFWGQCASIFQSYRTHSGNHPGYRKSFERMLWVVDKHWQGEMTDMQAFQEKAQDVLNSWEPSKANIVEQLILHQEQEAKAVTLDEEAEQYREWLKKGFSQGYRALFRTLKKDQVPYLRPFQQCSVEEKIQMRTKQWKEIWQAEDEPVHIENLEELCQQGRFHAARLEALTAGAMLKKAKSLSSKAAGIDAISNDLIRNLPFEGMQDLAQLLRHIEMTSEVPMQWLASLVVLIPKNATIERPIALTSSVYRFWCKMRGDLIKQWQSQLGGLMPWERAKPGSQCLHIALNRLLRAEVNSADQKFVVSTLIDLSNFYDRIDLQLLAERWSEVQYPPLMAKMAMLIYRGPRYLEGEGMVDGPLYARNGILAGDPQAPQVAKVYLYRAMKRFKEKFPEAQMDLWIDDASYDVVADRAEDAAETAVQAFKFLRAELQADNLLISKEKTGFLINNKALKPELEKRLTSEDPKVVDAMRDLGCDSAAGRLRRVKVVQKRTKQGQKKQGKLIKLKIPQQHIKIKLHKGSVKAGSMWGIEAMGLAPQRRRQHQLAMGRCLGLQAKGSLDVVMDMNQQHLDPGDEAALKQVKAFHYLAGQWPEDQSVLITNAWRNTMERLSSFKYPWKVVKGPMAALQAYLMEGGWDFTNMWEWWKAPDAFGSALTLHLDASWDEVAAVFKEACMRNRRLRMKKHSFCEGLCGDLDWSISHKMQKKGQNRDAVALRTWHQAALVTHEGAQYKECPHCKVEATPVHLLWLCKWTTAKVGPVDEDWKKEIEAGQHMELWARGFLQLPAWQVQTGRSSLAQWGTWQRGPAQMAEGEVVTLVIMATTQDQRSRHFLCGIVHHNEKFERQGVVSVVLPGRQTPARAWFQALMLAQEFALGKVVVQLHNVQAWEAWKSAQKRANVYDLCKGISEQTMKRLTVLYTHKEVILGVNSRWRLRMVDAKKALRERIDEVRDLASEEYLAKQDQKAKRVYSAAIQRVKAIVDDKSHFGNQKDMSGPEKRGLTRQRKSDLLRNLPLAAGTGHRWHQHKRGYKCERCEKFVTMQSPYTELLQLHQEPCEARPVAVSKGGKAGTRDQLLEGFLKEQGEEKQPGKHFWSIGAHYLKCEQCGINILKRSKMEALEKFMAQDCINHAWQPTPEWRGHRTHAMWRKGNTLQCSRCNGKAQQKDGTYSASSRLTGPCTQDEAQPSVRSFFKKT